MSKHPKSPPPPPAEANIYTMPDFNLVDLLGVSAQTLREIRETIPQEGHWRMEAGSGIMWSSDGLAALEARLAPKKTAAASPPVSATPPPPTPPIGDALAVMAARKPSPVVLTPRATTMNTGIVMAELDGQKHPLVRLRVPDCRDIRLNTPVWGRLINADLYELHPERRTMGRAMPGKGAPHVD